MNIHNLIQKKLELIEAVEEGTLTMEQAFETLEDIDESLEDKFDGYAAIDETLERDVEALGKEIKRLQERKKSLETSRKRLRDNVAASLEALDMKKIKTLKHTISRTTRKNYVIKDESLLPDEFRKRKFVETIDTAAVKERLKEGEEIEGAEIVEVTSLQIR